MSRHAYTRIHETSYAWYLLKVNKACAHVDATAHLNIRAGTPACFSQLAFPHLRPPFWSFASIICFLFLLPPSFRPRSNSVEHISQVFLALQKMAKHTGQTQPVS
mmetsp:Transcript_29016/g.47142  ORF Transcript_29016/g.47142 Transcript_29016/m.47142 type:complete len:105 (-) Transcript_29016:920-1234(-)